jgi:hypothetical protein
MFDLLPGRSEPTALASWTAQSKTESKIQLREGEENGEGKTYLNCIVIEFSNGLDDCYNDSVMVCSTNEACPNKQGPRGQ